jgi:hypothetical protein
MKHGSFFGDMNAPRPRILFVGNSITLHDVLEEIGWTRLCGMAASDEAHDYVHVLMKMLLAKNPSLGYAIAQAASWERQYWQPENALKEIERAPEWNADIIILRLSENTWRTFMRMRRGFTWFAPAVSIYPIPPNTERCIRSES